MDQIFQVLVRINEIRLRRNLLYHLVQLDLALFDKPNFTHSLVEENGKKAMDHHDVL